MAPNEPSVPWRDSKAKDLLRKALLDGTIPLQPTKDLSNRDIFLSIPELSEYNFDHFPSRLSGLRKQVAKSLNRKAIDEAAFANYTSSHQPLIVNHRSEPQWFRSEMQKDLKEDMAANKHKTMPLSALFGSRQAYQTIPYRTFYLHVKQEERRIKFNQYLVEKAKQRESRRTKRSTGTTRNNQTAQSGIQQAGNQPDDRLLAEFDALHI